jgi:hypothetical protein
MDSAVSLRTGRLTPILANILEAKTKHKLKIDKRQMPIPVQKNVNEARFHLVGVSIFVDFKETRKTLKFYGNFFVADSVLGSFCDRPSAVNLHNSDLTLIGAQYVIFGALVTITKKA